MNRKKDPCILFSVFSFGKRKKIRNRTKGNRLPEFSIRSRAGNRFLPGKREKSSSRVNRDDDDDIFICIDGLPRYDPSSFLSASVSLAFETRTFASNRRETVHTNINYDSYLNPYPPEHIPSANVSPPSPLNTCIQNLPSSEFHRDKFRYALPCSYVKFNRIHFHSVLPKKRNIHLHRKLPFLLSFQNPVRFDKMNYSNIVFVGRSRANIARNRCAGGPPIWMGEGGLVDIRLDKEGGALKAR